MSAERRVPRKTPRAARGEAGAPGGSPTSGEAQLGPEAGIAASLCWKERVKSGESCCENSTGARAGEPVLRGGSRFSGLLEFHLLLSGTVVRTFPFGVGLKKVGS